MKFSTIFTAALLTLSFGAIAAPVEVIDLEARGGSSSKPPTVPPGYKLVTVGNIYILTDNNGNFAGAFSKGNYNGAQAGSQNTGAGSTNKGNTNSQNIGDTVIPSW
ncbi:hypothetical protein L486_00873 [Kwoniella mangroviensis CBS 10435]|uniref:Uncharacterized protein n=1 Tax=Kwoniella mangroviensis CBS 10435 TaxID=1331196 RepID=A0A1B9J0C3_9TREE|nr:uncharacterized protein I203_04403 [Kwoniella mangroviensis CBS 8507]OCF61227.1 hypothetical protein L486_00873 [Kwoniella mangroviensis CBS 10435]OCF66825.1 hypothetical protein I203_04403 [Kwoniella mangroviensis CBS 8507]OCF77245.1 hypothetical protein I204_01231 [Kwoniella mangroviensis CBS 8886]